MTNPKDAIGCNKPPSSTVPQTVMAEVGVAMLEGACKYGRHNYRESGVRSSIYYDATRRHIDKWWEGQDNDPDSGLCHIVKAIASLVVLRDAMIQEKLTDDRPPKAPASFWDTLAEQTRVILERGGEAKMPFTALGLFEETQPEDNVPEFWKRDETDIQAFCPYAPDHCDCRGNNKCCVCEIALGSWTSTGVLREDYK